MILITSAAYISSGFAVEFGEIPPSFLPIGNKCLYEHQYHLLKDLNSRISISIPEDFLLDEYSRKFFETNRIEIIPVPRGLSLGQSIIHSLNSTSECTKTLKILHGDTLFLNLDFKLKDCISISKNEGFYERAVLNETDDIQFKTKLSTDSEFVLSGYFSFSDSSLLVRGITSSSGDFIRGINSYNEKIAISRFITVEWLDFGHLNTYHRSRAYMTTQRVFNEMVIDHGMVTKSSKNKTKIKAEAKWFSDLPYKIKSFVPNLYRIFEESDKSGYSLEYLYHSPLSDLYCFSRLPSSMWRIIFREIWFFLDQCSNYSSDCEPSASFKTMCGDKTTERLGEFSKQSKFDINSGLTVNDYHVVSIEQMAVHALSKINEKSLIQNTLIHGDLCFSNILYDFRAKRIKVIDPRGIDINGNHTLYGDHRYDIAKLYHSVGGFYDLIVTGRYSVVQNDLNDYTFSLFVSEIHAKLLCEFEENLIKKGFSLVEVLALNVHLFLSMLPLHVDDPTRQQALLLNAVRLYEQMNNSDNKS